MTLPDRRTPHAGEPAEEFDDEPLELSADMLAPEPEPKRFDFEREMSRFPPLSLALIAVLAIVFGWELATGALENEEAILKAGALQRAAVLRGEVWRVFSSMSLHGSSDHLIGNCIGLFLMGLAVEHAFGLAAALAIFLIGGSVGAAFCLFFEGAVTVGASGAIFAWWGAAIVFYWKYRQRLLLRDTRVGTVLLVWAGWTIFTGFMDPHVSNFSHVGGLLGGAALAAILPSRLVDLDETASKTQF